METSWRSCAIWEGKEHQGAAEGTHGHPRARHVGGRGQDPAPGTVTSSLANSSCSSSSSLRSVRLRFCFSRDCPMRAASSRSRSFCEGQVQGQPGPVPCSAPLFPSPRPPLHPGVPAAPSPRAGQAPAYLVQQVGDGIDVVVGLGDPDHPLSAQDWGRGAQGEPPHCRSIPPLCPLSRHPLSTRCCQGCPAEATAAPRWAPQVTVNSLGSSSAVQGHSQPRQPHGKRGAPTSPPSPARVLGLGERHRAPLAAPTTPPDTTPAPPRGTRPGRRDRERQAAETRSEVTSPAKSGLELQRQQQRVAPRRAGLAGSVPSHLSPAPWPRSPPEKPALP